MTRWKTMHCSGICAGTMTRTCLMPNGQLESHRLIVFGAERYRLYHNIYMPWKPQTLLIDYTVEFTDASGYTGYALPLQLTGHLIAIRILKAPHDRSNIIHAQQSLRDTIADTIIQWLSPHSYIVSDLAPLAKQLAYYRHGKINLTKLMMILRQTTNDDSVSDTLLTGTLVKKLYALSAAHERKLDQLMIRAYMLVKPTDILNGVYLVEQEALTTALGLERRQPHHPNRRAYVDAYFAQIQATAAYFTQHHWPFYPEEALRRYQTSGRPHWDLRDRHVYEQFGTLPFLTRA